MRALGLFPVLFLALLALAPRAQAQCAGFTDVSGTTIQPTCANVAWLKNRSVTLGCTATEYCPNEGVGRLQMAAFMNRVGNVLTPKVFSTEDNGGTLDFSSDHIVCQTADLPALARDYARTIDVDASLSFEINGFQTLFVVPVRSKDSGGSWQAMGQGSYPVVNAGVRHHTSALAPAILNYEGQTNPSTTLKFGLRVSRQNQFGPAITSWSCHLQAMVRNATYALEF